jgi:hypothetical protein
MEYLYAAVLILMVLALAAMLIRLAFGPER